VLKPDSEPSSASREMPDLLKNTTVDQGVWLTTVTRSCFPAKTASMTPAVLFMASASSARLVSSLV